MFKEETEVIIYSVISAFIFIILTVYIPRLSMDVEEALATEQSQQETTEEETDDQEVILRRVSSDEFLFFTDEAANHPLITHPEDNILNIVFDRADGTRHTAQSYPIDLLSKLVKSKKTGVISPVWMIDPHRNKTIQYYHDPRCQVNDGMDSEGDLLPQCFFSGKIYAQSSLQYMYITQAARPTKKNKN